MLDFVIFAFTAVFGLVLILFFFFFNSSASTRTTKVYAKGCSIDNIDYIIYGCSIDKL